MPKLQRCRATTTKGGRCKKIANSVSKGLCGLHSKVATKAKPRRFEKIERGLRFTRSIGSTASGVYALIKIIEYVVSHWSQVERVFHFVAPNAALIPYEQVIRILQSADPRSSPKYGVYLFETWFTRLPSHVQADVEREFGDVRQIVVSTQTKI